MLGKRVWDVKELLVIIDDYLSHFEGVVCLVSHVLRPIHSEVNLRLVRLLSVIVIYISSNCFGGDGIGEGGGGGRGKVK